MKTGNNEAPRYLCKVPRRNPAKRLLWFLFRRYLLNEDRYRVVRRFNGPRYTRCQAHTRKADAHTFRYYVETRDRYRPTWHPRVLPLRKIGD